jgi:hypothetical protein
MKINFIVIFFFTLFNFYKIEIYGQQNKLPRKNNSKLPPAPNKSPVPNKNVDTVRRSNIIINERSDIKNEEIKTSSNANQESSEETNLVKPYENIIDVDGVLIRKEDETDFDNKGVNWVQVIGFKITDSLNATYYLNNESEIKRQNNEIDKIISNDPDSKEKGAFETSDEFNLRKNILAEKKRKIKKEIVDPLIRIRSQYYNSFLKQEKVDLKFDLLLENYNADKSIWQIDLQDPISGIDYKLYLRIAPKFAEKLWISRNKIHVEQCKNVIDDNNFYYHFFTEENGQENSLFLIARGSQFEKVSMYEKIYTENFKGKRGFKEAVFPGGEIEWRNFFNDYFKKLEKEENNKLNEIEEKKRKKKRDKLDYHYLINDIYDEGVYGFKISFIVNKDGKVSDVKVLTTISPDFAKIASIILNNSPVWIPATRNNYPVKCYIERIIRLDVE